MHRFCCCCVLFFLLVHKIQPSVDIRLQIILWNRKVLVLWIYQEADFMFFSFGCSLMENRIRIHDSTWPRTWKVTTVTWRWSFHLTWMKKSAETGWAPTSTIIPTTNPTWLPNLDARQRTFASSSLLSSSSLSSVSAGAILGFFATYNEMWRILSFWIGCPKMLRQGQEKTANAEGLFQQDIAHLNSACVTTAWHHSKAVQLVDWPAISPDLSAIERQTPSTTREIWTVERLELLIKQVWERIPPTNLQQLSSVPKHLLCCSKERWWNTVGKRAFVTAGFFRRRGGAAGIKFKMSEKSNQKQFSYSVTSSLNYWLKLSFYNEVFGLLSETQCGTCSF